MDRMQRNYEISHEQEREYTDLLAEGFARVSALAKDRRVRNVCATLGFLASLLFVVGIAGGIEGGTLPLRIAVPIFGALALAAWRLFRHSK